MQEIKKAPALTGDTGSKNKAKQEQIKGTNYNQYNSIPDCILTDKTTVCKQDERYTNSERFLWIDPDAKHTHYLYASPFGIFKSKLGMGVQYVPQFALYPNTTNVIDGRIINLFEVIALMKSNDLRMKAKLIKEAREIGDESKRAELKSTLPYITHTGVFIPRRNDGLVLPGFTYQLDIDKITNADEVLQGIIHDKNLEVLIATKSVSGNGVKAILFIRPLVFLYDGWGPIQYREAYHKITDIMVRYFSETHKVKIDTQMKAISQPFYLFHAPDLFIHKNYAKWI